MKAKKLLMTACVLAGMVFCVSVAPANATQLPEEDAEAVLTDEEEALEEAVDEEGSDAEESGAEEMIVVEVENTTFDTDEDDDTPVPHADGLFKENGSKVFYEAGEMVTDGIRFVGDDAYYFDKNGYAVVNELVKVKVDGADCKYYFGDNAKAVANKLVKVTDEKGVEKKYYFGADKKSVSNQLIKVRDKDGVEKKYYMNKYGYAITNTLKEVTVDGETDYYFFNKYGYAITKTFKEIESADGKVDYYYFDSFGKAVKSELKKITSDSGTVNYYYFKADGKAVKDKLKKIKSATGENNYYYFKADGKAAKNKFKKIVTDTGNTYYYFENDGKAVKNTLRYINDYAYYFQSNGQAMLNKSIVIDGIKCYYFRENGKSIRNMLYTFTAPNGCAYTSYFNNEGYTAYGWNFYNGTWYNCTGPYNAINGTLSGGMMNAWNRINGISSNTGYFLVVDTNLCETYLFEGYAGNWRPSNSWKCSPGKPSTPTVKGFYSVTGRGYAFGTSSYTCYYYTQFYGNYLFHSVLYHAGTFNLMDGRLGMQLSHGCVRMDINAAKWIYSNIPNGTKVYIY